MIAIMITNYKVQICKGSETNQVRLSRKATSQTNGQLPIFLKVIVKERELQRFRTLLAMCDLRLPAPAADSLYYCNAMFLQSQGIHVVVIIALAVVASLYVRYLFASLCMYSNVLYFGHMRS